MRNKCTALNADLYHANLIVNYNCLCGYFNELVHTILINKVRHKSIINLLHITNMTNLQTFMIMT
jgi:hypothetical protein